jgi:hypothetical protein
MTDSAATALGRAPLGAAPGLRAWLAARWRHRVSHRALPAALRERLALERRERVLFVGRDPGDGCAVVATDRALYHRGTDDGWSRIGWERMTRVGWDAAAGRLVIAGRAGLAPARTALPLRECGTLPELAAERIAHTRLGSWRLPPDGDGDSDSDGDSDGDRSFLVEVRRRPVTGELLWVVSRDSGGQAERAITRLASEFGVTYARFTGRPRTGGTAAEAE